MGQDVVDCKCIGGYRLLLTFEGGDRREVDIAECVSFDGVFESLKDGAFFKQVRVEPDIGTIVWPNGADLCPDVLYEHSQPVAAISQNQSNP
ncbi:MAG: DUF2442 domain-containing protein [Phycisphaerae bacterium]